ncbi:homoserine dehydrogenase [Pseudomonas matsuisoli]|uniref:NAD-binding homoserine dehydrogenase n=1 Tax=Pseudomonas matsuisoli TaxID=1515666 RepID=A0A917PVG8_9PSED|nr:homoserine dehydrogenase [Pseudomonas matsuisoli]GGJ93713.1 NAD-binding homoserine dehydrogenase [Pseudomonas matsuisoli]
MNFELLFADHPDTPVRYALTGAKGGFSRTLLAQTRLMPRLLPAILCDLDVPGLKALCLELGYPENQLVECQSAEDVTSAPKDAVLLVANVALLDPQRYDILVEATGNPAVGHRAGERAIKAGRHVAMVSKEVDSVTGIALSRLAAEHGVVYTTADGDQPANLIGWVTWARILGLDIVAAGKSSEYDLVFDPETNTITQLDQTIPAPDMAGLLRLGDDLHATLSARRKALNGLKTSATADYCEMAVVATNTGLVPDVELLHYPIARVAELADIYALREDGGLVNQTGVIDVFNVLRLPEEASFAGGVFVVVRTHDAPTWELLAQKGHVVSRNGRYACLYLPYHFMGVETPISLLNAVLHKRASGTDRPTLCAVLGGRATADIPAGTVLSMGGHHHDVTGVQAVLLKATEVPDDVAPLYLAAHATTARDIKAGELLRLGDLSNPDADLAAAWNKGRQAR